jgi:CCR4-NOT transcription complex subunit 9
MSTLLQEIISVYPLLNPPELTPHASNRVCNALALLQCVASHPETRDVFLKAHIPLFLYPFLNTTSKSRPFEYLRLTSLGVIGALVKSDSPPTIEFLLTTEIIPLCLRIMETGSELSKVNEPGILADCRLWPSSFCKRYYWMIRVCSISVEPTIDFWPLHKF